MTFQMAALHILRAGALLAAPILAATGALAASSLPQQTRGVQRATAVKNAGVFHVATGTWTRGATAGAGFSVDTIYDNTAPSGYYSGMDMDWTEVGELPSTGGLGAVDTYHIDGFQIGYCTKEGTAGTQQHFTFYESLASCVDPSTQAPTAVFSVVSPGSSAVGTLACWIITFDLAGTSLEFDMAADADGIHDASSDLDSFGWTFSQRNVGVSSGGGPLLTGDPSNAPFGDDTYYQNPGVSSGGTGLGQQDQFWLYDPLGTPGSGCYWFGGYGPGNPWTGFHLELYTDVGPPVDGCVSFCSSTPNSTGGAAIITSTDGCDFDGDGIIDVSAAPVPDQPGIFFSSDMQVAGGSGVPFGNGLLCAAGNIVRHGVVFASGNVASQSIDLSSFGSPSYMQFWFRDPAAGGAFQDTSDAMITK